MERGKGLSVSARCEPLAFAAPSAGKLTSQHVQDEVQVSGEDLDALHAGDGPYGDKLVTIHLGHQVQILREVFPEDGREENTSGLEQASAFS